MLREYQMDVFCRSLEALAIGRKPLIVLPPGSGKTHIIEALMREFKSSVALAHRIELVRKIQGLFSPDECGLIWSQTKFLPDLPYQVGTIQTISRRLDSLSFAPELVVIDEAHHASASSYKSVLESFGSPYVGVTATPWRMDHQKLSEVFDVLIEGPSVAVLTEAKWLMPFIVFTTPLSAIQSTDVPISGGEYEPIASSNAAMSITADAVTEWLTKAENRQTIVFTVGTAHSQHVLEAYTDAGINAASISAIDKDRHKKIKDFEAGLIKILINCEIAIEGLDVTECECVQILRLTRSLRVYDQMVGRILRMSGRVGIVLDHAQTWSRFGFPFENRKWSLDGGDFGGTSLKICPSCGKLNKSESMFCDCGYRFSGQSREIVSIPKTINGTLVRVDSLVNFEQFRDEVIRRLLGKQTIHQISADLDIPQSFVKSIRKEICLTKNRSTVTQQLEVIALADQNISTDLIASRLNLTRDQVYGILRRANRSLRGKNADAAVKESALKLISEGVIYSDIAKKLGISKSTVQSWGLGSGYKRVKNNVLDIEQVADLIRAGKTQAEVKQLGVTSDLIQKAIKNYGLRKKQSRPILTKLCPHCGHDLAKSVGKTRQGKSQYLCLKCERKFSESNTNTNINENL